MTQYNSDIDEDFEEEYIYSQVHRRSSRFITSSEDLHLPPASESSSHSVSAEDVTPTPPPEVIRPAPEIRPVVQRDASRSPSVRHVPVALPPDGYIPQLDSDHIIRMPPPHELARPPPTPERTLPPLPSEHEDSSAESRNGRPRSRTPHRAHRRRHSSPESSSTALSQFDMVNDPGGRRSPLSVIHEVLSSHTSPNGQSASGSSYELRHHSPRVSRNYHFFKLFH